MSENHENAFDVLAGLQNALGVECPDCGEVNAGDAEVCEFCGHQLPVREEEEAGFTYVQSDGVIGGEEGEQVNKALIATPLEKAKNLELLRDMAKGFVSGEVKREEYEANVSKVLTIAKAGAELFSIPVFKTKISNLPEEQREIAEHVGKQFELYYAGCRKMMEPCTPAQSSCIKEGLKMVEEALKEMSYVQPRAIEIAKEEKEAAKAKQS
ncbi:MAG: zinc ribbon domain-containing protein [Firmicutes bacterium]|nr:zinc ribbon domain-containing protein [Bacillota bacterium]